MATISPFAALLPKPEWAERICELPYDVMSSEEARERAAGNDLSFLHVSKPEIDLPQGTDLYSAAVYARGRENFDLLRERGALFRDGESRLYLYRQVMGGHVQTGVVAGASCEEYFQGRIKKHELTRVDKEDDRVRHLEALDAQTGPVFLTYRAVAELDRLVEGAIALEPSVDFTASDGIRHSAWWLGREQTVALVDAFRGVPCLYIADGHHRCAAAGRVCMAREGRGESSRFLAVLFPHHQMQIMPYHRLVKDWVGGSAEAFWRGLESVMIPGETDKATPTRKHEVCVFAEGKWRSWVFRPDLTATGGAMDLLDVALLQRHVLAPLCAIEDPRTSHRISFVGGIRGTSELERSVASGSWVVAFSLYPTSIEDLMTVADGGGIMPPKSTWFEPKLRDGMFTHLLT